MLPSDPRPRRPRRRYPLVEGLEVRKLMSTASQSAEVQNVAATANSTQQHQATTDVVNSPVIQKFANLLYGPNSPTPMTPSARAQAPDIHCRVDWPVHRGAASVLRSSQHDPCLRRLRRFQSIPQGEVQHGALPAGQSVRDAHAGRPVCEPSDGHRRPVPPGPAPIRKYCRPRLEALPALAQTRALCQHI